MCLGTSIIHVQAQYYQIQVTFIVLTLQRINVKFIEILKENVEI